MKLLLLKVTEPMQQDTCAGHCQELHSLHDAMQGGGHPFGKMCYGDTLGCATLGIGKLWDSIVSVEKHYASTL